VNPIKYPLEKYPKALVRTGGEKLYVLAQVYLGSESLRATQQNRSFRQDFDLFMKVSIYPPAQS